MVEAYLTTKSNKIISENTSDILSLMVAVNQKGGLIK
jgi:hypothetical protein